MNIRASNSMNNASFEYEAYFCQKSSKNSINTNFNVSSDDLVASKANLLQLLIRFAISTEFDTRERQFNNYAGIMDQKSDPVLILEFDPIEIPMDFVIKWIDPLSIRHLLNFLN